MSKFILLDNDFSMILVKSASDQLRQMCLSQFVASDELAQMRSTHRKCLVAIYICSTHRVFAETRFQEVAQTNTKSTGVFEDIQGETGIKSINFQEVQG